MVSSFTLPRLDTLSLPELIGQMIVVRASGHLFDHQIRYPQWEANNHQLEKWLGELNIGGVILLGGSAAEVAWRSHQLQNWAKTPLLIAADIEEGVGQRFSGATWFPPPMALGEIAKQDLNLAKYYADKMGEITAQEALAIGINWILAPIVDVNNNPANPVINIRAWSDSPAIVADLSSAFIQGAKKFSVLTTAKHFPGHGDTEVDSHLDLPTLPHTEARLREIELPPFQQAIATGVDAVMTAHLMIPSWDKRYPATLSPEILTHRLRQQLGFTGLIVTDALMMGGITKYAPEEEIAIMAVEAGADILLMPPKPEIAIAAIQQAVENGRLKEEKIKAAVTRIWQHKARVLPSQPVEFTTLAEVESRQIVEQVITNSLRFSQQGLPLSTFPGVGQNLIVVDDVTDCPYLDRHTPSLAIPKRFGYQTRLVDNHILNSSLISAPHNTILQVFLRGNPFRGEAGLTADTKQFYQELINNNCLQALVIFGSPYVLDWFLSKIPEKLAFIGSYSQT
ncbi:MAG: beta-glucosidase, partial [Cyanobacteria bacterium J083]